MAATRSKSPPPVAPVQVKARGTSLDIEALKQIITLVEASEVSYLSWTNGTERVTLRRGPRIVHGAAMAAGPLVAPPVPAASAVSPPPVPAAVRAGPERPEVPGHVITSPFVGTFYRSPGPEQPPFAEVGAVVKKGQVLCIVEAMKLMNEIESEVSGRVAEVLASNGQPVEFGQPLFRIEPA